MKKILRNIKTYFITSTIIVRWSLWHLIILTFLVISVFSPTNGTVFPLSPKCLFMAFCSFSLSLILLNLGVRPAFSDCTGDLPLSDCSQFRLRWRWVADSRWPASNADVTRPGGGFHTWAAQSQASPLTPQPNTALCYTSFFHPPSLLGGVLLDLQDPLLVADRRRLRRLQETGVGQSRPTATPWPEARPILQQARV